MPVSRRRFLRMSTALGAAATVPVATTAYASARNASASAPQSDARWRQRDLSRKPNVAILVLDDVGFADLSCFGSEGLTPNIDKLAGNGVRFNNFHVTALCAPTRACLLTGSNAHAVGVGNIAEWGRDHPAYRGWIRPDALTLAEMLQPAGYATMALGKWHLSSLPDQNVSGPYDHWPNGRGFDRWYGAHGNAIDHFHPEVFENTHQVRLDKQDGYHFTEDLVGRASDYVKDHIAATDDQPFFMYLAFGACHFPFHPPADYLQRERGRYDAGWDALRQSRFERQQALGILPPDTRLSASNPRVPDWQSLTAEERRVSARMQEAYAAFLKHTDDQIGRFVDMLAAEGQLDNTILMVLSDNGAASGGPVQGMLDVRRVSYMGEESLDYLVDNIDLIGTQHSQCMYAPGWGNAGNTPLQWFKGDTHGGGTRSPLIVHWPQGDIGQGQILDQYHHAIDIVPSVLEMTATKAPVSRHGKRTLPVQGDSFAYAFDAPAATTSKRVQYFETLGDRAIWSDGWKAVVRHHGDGNFEDDVWELYHTDKDFSETVNLAEQRTDKLVELVALWDAEAERHGILPMANNTFQLYKDAVPPPRRRHVFYPGMSRLDRLSAPDLYHFDATLKAGVALDSDSVSGVLLASGDGGAGYEWYLRDGFVKFCYVFTREQRFTITSQQRVGPGTQQISLDWRKTGESSARLVMHADGRRIGEGVLPKLWGVFVPNSGVRCGANHDAPISDDYIAPGTFAGVIERVIVDVAIS
ncbi:MAG: arylsulfatase [Pseudomonadota bacterium]